MKTTKIMKFIYTMLIPVFLFGFLTTSIAQENEGQKQVKIKMVKEVNGERVVIDTTFDISSLEDIEDIPELEEFLKNNDMEDFDFNIVDINDLTDMDVEIIESEENGEVITKTIIIKSSDDGEIETDKEYNIVVHTSDSSEHGKIMKVSVDGDGHAYYFSDDEDIHEMDINVGGEKHMIIVKKSADGDEANVMVTEGNFSLVSDEGGKSIRIEDDGEGNKKVIIENEDGTTEEIITNDEKGAFMIDEEGNLKKVSEDSVWVGDDGEMITLEVNVDDDDKTIIIKENGTTIEIKDLDEKHNVWVYTSDDDSDTDEDVEVFIEMIKKTDGDKTITIKKKVILKQVCEKDMENFEKSGLDLEPGEDNKLELEKLVFAPNPSDGKFTLKFNTPDGGKTSISIYDVNGTGVYNETIRNFDGAYNKEIDISSEGHGTYFLKIQQGKKFSTRKIILE